MAQKPERNHTPSAYTPNDRIDSFFPPLLPFETVEAGDARPTINATTFFTSTDWRTTDTIVPIVFVIFMNKTSHDLTFLRGHWIHNPDLDNDLDNDHNPDLDNDLDP